MNQSVPLRALGGLDVGGLLAGLPAAGEHDGALDGRALLAVDVLRVGESQGVEVLAGELDLRCDPSSVTVTPRSWMALTWPRVPFSTRGCPGGRCCAVNAIRSPSRRP